jgi:hypothetical protein
MIVPSKNQKTYGVLHTENYFSFLGFCKKVNSDEIQKIDVYLDDVLINTIIADKHLQRIEDIYELDGFGFEYILPNEYIGKKSVISFKNHETQENLQNSPYKLINQKQPKFNENRFLFNLNQPVNEEKIKDIYGQNIIGFIASKENLEDSIFMGYIKKLIIQFPEIQFKVFCFNKNISFEENINLTIIEIKDIYDVINNVEILILTLNDYTIYGKLISITKNCNNILQIFFNQKLFNLSQRINEYDSKKDLFNFKNNQYILNQKDTYSSNHNFAKLFFSELLNLTEHPKNTINDNDLLSDWIYFNLIKYSIGNANAKAFLANKDIK